jgi:pilus assembly protein CpaE
MATNLATSIQQTKQRETVALVDLDMHGGDLGLFLDLHPQQGLKHLAKDISRLDATIVRSSLVTHGSGLQLLGSGYEGFDELDPATGSTMRILGLLRSMHRHVVVDCGHVLEPAVKEALDCSDQIVVVTTLSLPVIRRTKRLLGTLAAAHYPAGKVVVVVNRYVNEQKELLSQTEDMLGVRVAGLIPNDYETAREAMEHGKPLTMMAARTAIGQWYLGGADLLMAEKVDGTAAGKGQSKAARFFGRCLSTLKLEPRAKPSVV